LRIVKRWIAVGDAGNTADDEAFLSTVRKSACGPFTTVLGPAPTATTVATSPSISPSG
jgi:hypothetical protein